MTEEAAHDTAAEQDGEAAGAPARLDAADLCRWLTAMAEDVEREAEALTALDAAIGDADHGANMRRGFAAVATALAEQRPPTPGAVLKLSGRTLISTVGGASGPLYGTLLRVAGKELGDDRRVSDADLCEALRAGVDAVTMLGGARAGDATMLDALLPGVEMLPDYGAAHRAAHQGALATVPMLARKGRASYLAERSIGHQDPGATSAALLLAALDRAVGSPDHPSREASADG